MKSAIINLLVALCLLTATLSNAQNGSNEVMTAKGTSQELSQQPIIEVEEEMVERIKRGDLLNPIGASAYDTYTVYAENDQSDPKLVRKLKRNLVAALAEVSDKALTEYFDEGGDFIFKYMSNASDLGNNRNVPIDQYYFTAADLLGEDHYLYGEVLSKGYFVEALKFRYIEKEASETVKEKLKTSISLDPNASYTYNELGQVYFDEGNYELACDNYVRALKINASWELPKEALKMAKEALASVESKNKKG